MIVEDGLEFKLVFHFDEVILHYCSVRMIGTANYDVAMTHVAPHRNDTIRIASRS